MVWWLVVGTKPRQRGIRAYFEGKIGVTVRFVPSLRAKITLKKRPDLNFFEFPGEERLRKKWSAFCRRADKEFMSTKNLRVCSERFETKIREDTFSN